MRIQAADGPIITLDENHWQSRIVANHPELAKYRDKVIEALRSPAGVFRSKRDQETRIYVKVFAGIEISGSVFTQMPLLVYVREHGNFVVTAHFQAGMWRSLGQQVWPS